ncbi:hypothetical protein NLI96_g3760 [Meripilus lineatus]|uniref:Uncharacterized protein n=1 Tax=Meripilus lineatus TaxID=2056292 RepID=A0AAD5V681_9APHY|nr:hypothetical protein NLI96_g3760 [Physisporinus lineatus]
MLAFPGILSGVYIFRPLLDQRAQATNENAAGKQTPKPPSPPNLTQSAQGASAEPGEKQTSAIQTERLVVPKQDQ